MSKKNKKIKCITCKKYVNKDSVFCPFCGDELSKQVKCFNCGRYVYSSDKYCIYCGIELANHTFCKECNKPILKSDNYCIYCGAELKNHIYCDVCNKAILKTDKYCIYCGNKNSYANKYVKQDDSTTVLDLSNDLINPTDVNGVEENHVNNNDVVLSKYKVKKPKHTKLAIIITILVLLVGTYAFLATRKITITYVDTLGVTTDNPTEYRFFDFKVPLNDIEKDGYTFKGWYIYDENHKKLYYTALGVDLSFGDDMKLHADFKPINYHITYNKGFSTVANGNKQNIYNINSRFSLVSLEKDGYIFDGWYDDNDELITIIDGSKMKGDINLTAKWREDYNGQYSYKVSTSQQDTIGYITINADNVKVRNYPSTTDGSKVGLVHKDFLYGVYDTVFSDGYTWYEIGDSLWIPNNGSWATYHGGNVNSIAIIRINSDSLRIRDSANINGTAIGYAKKDDIYNVYGVVNVGSYTWYRIGDNKWIGDNSNWVRVLQKNFNYDVASNYGTILIKIDELSLARYPSTSSEYYYEYSTGDTIYFDNNISQIETCYADGYTWYKVSNPIYAIDQNGNNIYVGEGWLPDLNGEWLQIIR